MKIGIIGCGNMGAGMARQLLKNNQDVACYDGNATICTALRGEGLAIAEDAVSLARNSDLVIFSLPHAAAVRAVTDEVLPVLAKGSVIVDTSTSDPTVTRELAAQADEAGVHFLDAPVSGGPAAANSGTMTMLIGGEADILEKVRPILAHLTQKIVYVGGSGAGHAAKIANNMLCAANLILVGEAVKIAEAAGIAPKDLLEGVNAGSGRSGVSEVNFPKWVLSEAFNSGFTMGLMRKDVRLATALAEKLGVSIEGFRPIADLWETSRDAIADAEDFNKIAEFVGASK